MATQSLGRGADVRFQMTPAELNMQLNSCAGEIIVYGCYETALGPSAVKWWAGKLMLVAENAWVVELGPDYLVQGSGCEIHPTPQKFSIPLQGYTYTFIWPAVDFVAAKLADEAARQRQRTATASAFASRAVLAPVTNSGFKSAFRPQTGAGAAAPDTPAPQQQQQQPQQQQPQQQQRRPQASPDPTNPRASDLNALAAALAAEEEEMDADPSAPVVFQFLDRSTAMDPDSWPEVLASSADLVQLRLILQVEFLLSPQVALHKKDNAVTAECIDSVVDVAATMVLLNASQQQARMLLARTGKRLLTRLLVIKKLHEGHAAEYVGAFAEAAQQQQQPSWIRTHTHLIRRQR